MRTMTGPRRQPVAAFVATEFLPFGDLALTQRDRAFFHLAPLGVFDRA